MPAGSQYDERPRGYTFRNPEIASDDWTRIDRARRPRSCVYKNAGGLSGNSGLFLIATQLSVVPPVQRAFGAHTAPASPQLPSVTGCSVVDRKSTRLNSSHVEISY